MNKKIVCFSIIMASTCLSTWAENPNNPPRQWFSDNTNNEYENSNSAYIKGEFNPVNTPEPLTTNQLIENLENALTVNNWKASIDIAKTLIRKDENPMGWYGLALALTGQGKYSKALEVLPHLNNSSSSMQKAAAELAGTLHLQLADLALLKKDSAEAKRQMNYFENYAEFFNSNSPETLRAQRIYAQLKPQYAVDNRTLRIGVLLPLTGTYKNIGQNLLKAMQMAVFENNSTKIILYPEDSGSTPNSASKAGEKLANLGVNAIIGPLLSTQVDALKPVIKYKNIPVIALSSDSHVATPYIHLLSYRPNEQARLIVKHAVSQGRKRFAALVPSTPYGYEAFDAFRDEVANMGAILVDAKFYNPEKANVSASLEGLLQLDLARENLRKEKAELKAEYAELGNALEDEKLARLNYLKHAKPEAVVDFDALFVPTTAENLGLITSQMATYDLDKQDIMFLGTSAWDTGKLEKGEDYIRNGRFAVAPNSSSFTNGFTDIYGIKSGALTVLGFDAINILAQAFKHPNGLKAGLLRPEGFAGAGGAVRFQADGQTQRAYGIKQVTLHKLFHVEHAKLLLPPELPKPLNPNKYYKINRYSPW